MKKTGRRPSDEEAFRKRMGAKGLKVTAQRLAVHGAMSELIHGSADAVYEMVRDKCRIRPSTVYNILCQTLHPFFHHILSLICYFQLLSHNNQYQKAM